MQRGEPKDLICSKQMDAVARWNRQVYENASIVAEYSTKQDLFNGEVAVLKTLGERLPDMAVLDLGVGTGRTTHHMAAIARSYVGIDVSADMIKVCSDNYSHLPCVYSLACADACTLPFKTDSFDLVLFSFNGLDYVGHKSRLQAIDEVRRVLRPDGYFMFSTHLLPRIRSRLQSFGNSPEWGRVDWRTRFWFRWYNRHLGRCRNKEWAIVRDASHDFALKTYYVMPEIALAQLCKAGFGTARIFKARTSEEMNLSTFRETRDEWVYILACN